MYTGIPAFSQALAKAFFILPNVLYPEALTVRVLHQADSFATVVIRFAPGEIETISHTSQEWDELLQRIDWP